MTRNLVTIIYNDQELSVFFFNEYGALGASFIYLILRTTISQTSNEDQNGNGP